MASLDKLRSMNSQKMNSIDMTLKDFTQARDKTEEKAAEDSENSSKKETSQPILETPVIKELTASEPVKTKTEEPVHNNTTATDKKKMGRPRKWGEPTSKITFYAPEKLKDDIETASLFYGSSVADYIIALIKKDFDENGDSYRQAKELLGKFKKI